MSHPRGPKEWPNPNPLAQQGGAQGAGLGQSPRGLQWSRVKWKLGAGPVRLGCVEGMGQRERGREGGRGQAKRIQLRRLLEAELSK